jgi:hypothetical protein
MHATQMRRALSGRGPSGIYTWQKGLYRTAASSIPHDKRYTESDRRDGETGYNGLCGD